MRRRQADQDERAETEPGGEDLSRLGLRRVGRRLECVKCGAQWTRPALQREAKAGRYWECPKGCNAEAAAAEALRAALPTAEEEEDPETLRWRLERAEERIADLEVEMDGLLGQARKLTAQVARLHARMEHVQKRLPAARRPEEAKPAPRQRWWWPFPITDEESGGEEQD